jgi:putative transposase
MEKKHVTLSIEDKELLLSMTNKGILKAREYKRIWGLLHLDSGKTFQEVSQILTTSYQTLSIWSHSYKESGLTFLKEKDRSGRPSKFSAIDKAKITALACSDSPDGHSQWSLRLLADKAVELELVETISYSTIGLVLKKRTSAAS